MSKWNPIIAELQALTALRERAFGGGFAASTPLYFFRSSSGTTTLKVGRKRLGP